MENIKAYGMKFYAGIDSEYMSITFIQYKRGQKEAIEKEKANVVIGFGSAPFDVYLVTVIGEALGKYTNPDTGDTFIRMDTHFYINLVSNAEQACEECSIIKERFKKSGYYVERFEVETLDPYSLADKRDWAQKISRSMMFTFVRNDNTFLQEKII